MLLKERPVGSQPFLKRLAARGLLVPLAGDLLVDP